MAKIRTDNDAVSLGIFEFLTEKFLDSYEFI